jgi:phosphatidylserine synthase
VFGLTPVACFHPIVSSATATVYLIWLAAAFFYLLCAITRLGAYNIQEDNHAGFIGLPTTISGLMWSSFFLIKPSITLSIALLLGCGLAMISPIRIPRPQTVGMTVIISWATVLMITHGVRSM